MDIDRPRCNRLCSKHEMSLTYALGDVHGCHDQLLVAVAKIKEHAKARSYCALFLGDYIDRGPHSGASSTSSVASSQASKRVKNVSRCAAPRSA